MSTITPTLVSERLRLDPLRVDDARAMAAVLADPSLYRFIGGRPPTEAALETQYASWLAGPPRAGDRWLNWVVRLAIGEAIGHAQATVFDNASTADIAWVIGAPWQARGFATEAARAVVAWLATQGVVTVTAHVHPDNVASAKVAERAGLRRTAEEEGGEIVWRRVVPTEENASMRDLA